MYPVRKYTTLTNEKKKSNILQYEYNIALNTYPYLKLKRDIFDNTKEILIYLTVELQRFLYTCNYDQWLF